jgi:hypothetical protein
MSGSPTRGFYDGGLKDVRSQQRTSTLTFTMVKIADATGSSATGGLRSAERDNCGIPLAAELTPSKDVLFDCNYEARSTLYALHPVSNAGKKRSVTLSRRWSTPSF